MHYFSLSTCSICIAVFDTSVSTVFVTWYFVYVDVFNTSSPNTIDRYNKRIVHGLLSILVDAISFLKRIVGGDAQLQIWANDTTVSYWVARTPTAYFDANEGGFRPSFLHLVRGVQTQRGGEPCTVRYRLNGHDRQLVLLWHLPPLGTTCGGYELRGNIKG